MFDIVVGSDFGRQVITNCRRVGQYCRRFPRGRRNWSLIHKFFRVMSDPYTLTGRNWLSHFGTGGKLTDSQGLQHG